MRATLAASGAGRPSICSWARWPTRRPTTSSGATAASSSMRVRSTISTMRPSTATRSPGCARRWDTRPVSGARSSQSFTALRASSAAAWAACSEARAPLALLVAVSSAVLEMKPWSTSARLLASVRSAISSWARAASAWSCAWRSRHWYSVSSRWPMSWPACTRSPSRTSRVLSSAATLALTRALLTALSPPDTGSVAASSARTARATSPGASSMAWATGLEVGAAVLPRLASSARPMAKASSRAATVTIRVQRKRRLMGRLSWRCRRCRRGRG